MLLTDTLVSRLEHRIASRNLQIPLEVTVCKSFAISTGRLEESLDLSLRDNYAHFLYILFYENQDALGDYRSCYLKFTNPNISNIYLSAGLDIKLPSVPGAGPADVGGFAFTNDSQKKYAYYTFLDAFNCFNEKGSPISEEIFHSDFFALPFRLSFEIDRFKNATKITQRPFNAGQPLNLFIRFKEPTTKTLRVLCFYRCIRRFQLDSARLGYMSHTTDQ